MATTHGLPPFAVAQFEQATILTALLTELRVNNASWFKTHLLGFIASHRPRLLVVNLANIQFIDRIGVGILISLNSSLKNDLELYFSGLQPSVDQHLQAMYLRQAFRIVDPAWPCLLCQQESCEHVPGWDERLQEFLFIDGKPPEGIPRLSEIPRYQDENEAQAQQPSLEKTVFRYENNDHYLALEALRKRKLFWQKFRNYTLIGSLSSVFVGGAILVVLLGLNSQWLAFLNQATDSLKRPNYNYDKNRELQYHEIIDRFDKNGDGVFSKEDWIYLRSSEKQELINQGFKDDSNKKRSPFALKP